MHPVIILFFVAVVLGVIFIPSLWVKRVIKKYKLPADLFSGTGAELAQHLLHEQKIENVVVEQTDPDADHYDPIDKAVRLSPEIYNGKSLSAIAIAAHEVGHALQDAKGYHMFKVRLAMAPFAVRAQKLGGIAIICMPLVAIVTRSPAIGAGLLIIGVASMFVGTIVHLVTLPVEWDASFGKALPLLEKGEYIPAEYLPHARKILKAAALTYVAASLVSLLSLSRWIAILRR